MNIKEYISSGIVESYVLGLADVAERAEFESMCAEHAEVRDARNAFELSLEKQALAGSGVPPQHVKEKLFGELSINPQAGTATNSNNFIPPVADQREQARVVKSTGWSKYLVAASVALLVGSSILNIYLFNQYKDYSTRYSDLLASQNELASSNKALQTSLDTYRNNMSVLRDTSMSVIRMAGSSVPKNGSPEPGSVATIYWDKKSTEVYLLVNSLPKPTSDKQYQLWAIVDGKPVSAGVFDFNQADAILKMTNISGPAQAFAITLEKTGGSETPQGSMYVLGAI